MKDEVLATGVFDPKVKIYWYTQGLLLHAVLTLAIIGVVTFPLWLVFGWFVVGRQFERIHATLHPKHVHLKSGVFYKSEKTIPLEKIVDLSLHTGPLLDAFGLASVQVETAGGSAQGQADMVLHGLSNATDFRDAVLAQRDRVVEGSGSTPTDASGPSQLDVLVEIRDSLARIEARLDARDVS